MASINTFRMRSGSSFIELHLKLGLSAILMGLVFALSEKTRNSVKIKPFF